MKHTKLLTLLIVTIISFTAFSQFTIPAQKTIKGNSWDIFPYAALTTDGGFIIGGFSYSGVWGHKSEAVRGNAGYPDFWVIKFNAEGKIQWDKTIGGKLTDELHALIQTADGGYMLGGYSASNISFEKTENSRGGSDYWIVKLGRKGDIEWDKTIGGSGADVLHSIKQTTDGGYILGGYSLSDISGEKTESSRGGSDYWVVKLNSNGIKQWDKTIGGAGNDQLNAIQQTADGGYILGGYSSSNISGEKTENSYGNNDYWMVKLNNNGIKQWDKTIGGAGNDQLNAMQQTADGGFILGGESDSNVSGEKTENSRGSSDYWIVKLDTQGDIEWDKTIGGNSYDVLHALQQTKDGGYISGGQSASDSSGEKTENTIGEWQESDYWVVKLNSNGGIEWDKTIGGNATDILTDIHEIKKNNYLLVGYSGSPVSGDKTQPTRDLWDFWTVNLHYNNTAIAAIESNKNTAGISNNTANKIIVFPNPVKEILHIQTGDNVTFVLTNQYGAALITKTITGNGAVNVQHLSAGLYYLKNITTGETRKVIITK
ncbi:MAG: T9SS type A sorting domain-containing protein [Panacibacter sp.]